MDGLPLTHNVVYGRQTAIQGQGRFPKHGLPEVIPPVVWKGYYRWLAVYSTKPWSTVCTACFLCPQNYPSWYDLYRVESNIKTQINKYKKNTWREHTSNQAKYLHDDKNLLKMTNAPNYIYPLAGG